MQNTVLLIIGVACSSNNFVGYYKKKFNERLKQEEDVPHEYVFNKSKYVTFTLKTEIDTPKTCTYF